ncbi:hypothetical protein PAXRUDRAFT_22679 [Paxillus rubicundulus Ve08.2h10]|uniref:Uncharacterized protein n=1 Tax=Paxillus rubicundulus Ve08.2h10 TaxID=930991 RepID=A0A0D0D4Y6_9AGAM|nr:hypothetical protein PAXRUDRAFT_22679 [Paxillus rubicundulus Ve08.2h10]
MSISQKFHVEVKDIVTDEDRQGIAGIYWRDLPQYQLHFILKELPRPGSQHTNTTPIMTNKVLSDSCHINACPKSVDSVDMEAGVGGILVAGVERNDGDDDGNGMMDAKTDEESQDENSNGNHHNDSTRI